MEEHVLEETVTSFMTCSVCMEVMCSELSSYSQPIQCVPCGHRCCANCIFSWISEFRKKCPFCRTEVKQLICDNLLNEMATFFSGKLLTSLHHRQITSHIIKLPSSIVPRQKFGVALENIQNFPGVFVKEVEKNSDAYFAGLRAGDTILAINAKPILDMRNCKDLITRYSNNCEFFISKRKLIVTDVLKLDLKLKGTYFMTVSNHDQIKKHSYIKSCNGTTGSNMLQELLKLGANVDGKKLFYFSSKKRTSELIVEEF